MWSRRGLWKDETKQNEALDIFDLLIQPGEINEAQEDAYMVCGQIAIVKTPPVTLFDSWELLDRDEARRRLNLDMTKKYILFSPGPGNLKDIENISYRISGELQMAGYSPVWLQSPIATREQNLPEGVMPLKKYPIAQFLKAFEGFVSAAGYNSCYESAMAGLPTLFLPNEKLLDNQIKRAGFLKTRKLAVICENEDEMSIKTAVLAFMELLEQPDHEPIVFPNGAYLACQALSGMGD